MPKVRKRVRKRVRTNIGAVAVVIFSAGALYVRYFGGDAYTLKLLRMQKRREALWEEEERNAQSSDESSSSESSSATPDQPGPPPAVGVIGLADIDVAVREERVVSADIPGTADVAESGRSC